MVRRLRFTLFSWLVFASTLSAAHGAQADCNDAQRQSAVPWVLQARELADRGDHQGSLQAYERAYDTCEDPWLLPYIATQQVRAGRYLAGLETADRYDAANLTLPAVPTSDDESIEAQRARQRISAFQELQAVRAIAERQVTTITVVVDPTDATLSLDGQSLDVAGGQSVVRREGTGEIVFRAEAEGFRNAEERRTLVPGSDLTVELRLVCDDCDEEPREIAPRSETRSSLPIIGLAGVGVGAILSGLSVAALIDAGSARSDLSAQRTEASVLCASNASLCDQANQTVSRNETQVDRRRNVAIAGIALGGALTVTGAVLAITQWSSANEEENETAYRCQVGLGAIECSFAF